MAIIDKESLPYRPCVGLFLTNTDGLIFTAERLDMPGAWQMPQGGIDGGETPEQAGIRELWEETSVAEHHITLLGQTRDWLTYDLPDHLIGKAFKGKYRGQKQHWLHCRLNAPDSVINLETDHPEFGRWKWSTPSEVISEIVDFKRDLYRQVLDQF